MVPNWILKQIFAKGGHHLPKRERAKLYEHHYPPRFDSRFQQFGQEFIRNELIVPGNLNNDQYRLFKGQRILTARDATCRVCGKIVNVYGDVKTHGTEGCYKIFNDAVDKWIGRKDKEMACVWCCQNTLHKRWGIPMCLDAECIEGWKFDTVAPSELLKLIAEFGGAKV